MENQNQAVILVKRPERDATPDCFEVQSQALQPLAAGEVRVAVEYVSVDAGARTMLLGEGFHRQVPLGGVVLAGHDGQKKGEHEDESLGDHFESNNGVILAKERQQEERREENIS